MKTFSAALLMSVGIFMDWSSAQEKPPLRLVQTIPMPNVEGRIDHLAIDLAHKRLYVAALVNNTLEVVDLGAGKVVQTVSGLKEPQGVVFVSETGTLYVTTGGDGKCFAFSGNPLAKSAEVEAGEDADNIRYDPVAKKLYVGYGSGALRSIDAPALKAAGDVKLEAHPESFQLERSSPRIYVNVPNARQIAVIDRVKQAVLARWPVGNAQANFPMALIEANHRLLVATRKPAKLLAFDTASGKVVAEMDCAGDADDLFYDAARKLIYVACGEGVIDVFAERDADHYPEVCRILAAAGARTALWVPELNQLFLAVPKRQGQESAIRVYQHD
jgi:YVTN family beta-propeller protein